MTIQERKKYIFISKICKWVRKNINYRLGILLLDILDYYWIKSF